MSYFAPVFANSPKYFFEAVDSNFEIAVVQFQRKICADELNQVYIRRGFGFELKGNSPSTFYTPQGAIEPR